MAEVVYQSWNGKGVSASVVRDCVEAVCSSRRAPAHTSISVSYIHGTYMRRLNRTYRGKDYVTDILSFPAGVVPGVEHDDKGDIFLCHTVIAKKARQEQKTYVQKSVELIVHGCLHLFGFDHEHDKEWGDMVRVEGSILKQLKQYVK